MHPQVLTSASVPTHELEQAVGSKVTFVAEWVQPRKVREIFPYI
jgi:hypothetical protein